MKAVSETAATTELAGAGEEPRAIRKLAALAAVNLTIYGAFYCYYKSDLVDARYVNHHISNLIVTILPVILLLLSYQRGYKILSESSNSTRLSKIVGAFAVLMAVVAVAVPNFHSSDLFSYIDVGWLQFRYQLNPYVTTVDQIANYKLDPMLTGVWAWNPCPYGFAFAQLTRLLCAIGAGNLVVTACCVKFVNFIAYLLTGACVYFGAKRLGLERPDLSLYLYGWSPFVMIQSLANAHNDVLMTLFTMAGLWAAIVSPIFAVAALVVSTQIKFLWIVSIPFVLLYISRRFGIKTMIGATALGGASLAVLSMPYIADLGKFRFDIMRQDLSFNGKSLPALIENIGHGIERMLYQSSTLPWFERGLFDFIGFVKTGILLAFAGFAVWLFIKSVKSGAAYNAQQMVRDSLLLALLAVCVVSSKFHPWYILMFFPVALWLPERSELRQLAVALSCTQLFAITYLGHSGGINYVLLTATPLLFAWFRYKKSRSSDARLSPHL